MQNIVKTMYLHTHTKKRPILINENKYIQFLFRSLTTANRRPKLPELPHLSFLLDRVLEEASRDDDELRAVLGDSIGKPELMRKKGN